MKAKKLNLKLITKSLLAGAVMMALTACPKNSSSDTPAATAQVVGGYVNCTNCNTLNTSGQEFLVTESVEFNNAFLLRLGYAGVSNGYNYSASNYQGVVAASRGDLNIYQPIYQGYCSIPAGIYTVGTLSAGQYSAGIIQGLRLTATGPANLVLNLDVAQISSQNNRDQYGNLLSTQRLFSTRTYIESVNGQACNLSFILQ
jgi:hypothetical protein